MTLKGSSVDRGTSGGHDALRVLSSSLACSYCNDHRSSFTSRHVKS